MTIEDTAQERNELAMWEVQKSLTDLERRITEHVATMPATAVPATLYEIEGWFRTLQRIRAVVEAKAAAVWDEAVPMGAAWKGPDGEAYEFDGTHSRKVSDPEGLRAALLAVFDERKESHTGGYATSGGYEAERAKIMSAFRIKTETLLTPVNELAEIDPRYRDVRDDFCTWQNGPKHLRKVETTVGNRRK